MTPAAVVAVKFAVPVVYFNNNNIHLNTRLTDNNRGRRQRFFDKKKEKVLVLVYNKYNDNSTSRDGIVNRVRINNTPAHKTFKNNIYRERKKKKKNVTRAPANTYVRR